MRSGKNKVFVCFFNYTHIKELIKKKSKKKKKKKKSSEQVL